MAAQIKHPCFPQPEGEVFVWKYLELPHFLDLLISRQLHFARADQFEDPYEVGIPKNNYDRDLIGSLFGSLPKEGREKILQEWDKHNERLRYMYFISCWHMSQNESAAMWKLYAKNNNSVAIKCKYDALVSALSPECFIGSVSYVDYDTYIMPMDNAFYPVMHKRLEYAYESEVRCVIVDWEPLVSEKLSEVISRKELVDLECLVDQVYLSPKSDKFFAKVVSQILEKFGLNKELIKSNLHEPPQLSYTSLLDAEK